MPGTTRYPDTLRRQAIALSTQGKGYKAIAAALGVPRDTVRSWILRYRESGQMGSVADREALYAAAREEYEKSAASLWTIAQNRGLNYYNIRNFLYRYHPESRVLHQYQVQQARVQQAIQSQLSALARLQEDLRAQLP